MQKQSNAEQIQKISRRAYIIRRIGMWILVLFLLDVMTFGANNRIDITKYT